MEPTDLDRDHFIILREEIKGIQVRLFWTVISGLFGIPVLTFWAADAENLALLLVPFSVLVLIVMFLTQQQHIMRAGRYIRERIEATTGSSPGWETWLESRPEYRHMDRHFVGCFIVIFFVYYVMTIGLAMRRLASDAAADPSGQYRVWMLGSAVVYAVAAIWAFSTLVHHWKSSVSTTTD